MFHQYHPSVQRTLGLYHYDFCHWFQDNSTHFWKCSHRNCLEMPCCIQASSTVLKKLALVAQMSHLCLLESEAVRHKLKNSQKMHFRYFLAVFELMSDSLTAIYVKLHQCPSHHSILLTLFSEKFSRKFFENWRFWKMSFFWVGHFEFFFRKKKKKICFIHRKISLNLYGRMDGSKFWRFPWFLENSLVCVILRYTV